MSKDFIKRETALNLIIQDGIDFAMQGSKLALDIANYYYNIIEKIPTADVVEVTHCENCNCFELMTSNNQHFCNQFGGYVTENDYCSRPSPKNRKDK